VISLIGNNLNDNVSGSKQDSTLEKDKNREESFIASILPSLIFVLFIVGDIIYILCKTSSEKFKQGIGNLAYAFIFLCVFSFFIRIFAEKKHGIIVSCILATLAMICLALVK
jgi:hypothetical protein